MIIDGRRFRTAFILGAGATRGAIGHVVVNRKRVKPPLNGDFFHVVETLARAQGRDSPEETRLARLRRFFREGLPTPGLPPMETAFSLLYTATDFPEIYRRGLRGRRPDPGESRELEDFLRLLFGALAVLDDGSGEPNGYDRLVASMETGDAVLTLNYDTTLDSALHRVGWDPRNGYALTGTHRKFKWRAATHGQQAGAGVRLLKLHGSMNWWVRGSFSNLASIFEAKPVRVTPPRSNEFRGYIRQIIPPIYGKTFRHRHWRHLWTEAYRALLEADALVVVGCSIVDTDFHLQALIRRVVSDRKRQGRAFKRAVFVDVVKIRRKWQRLFRGLTPSIVNFKRFEDLLSRGLHS